MKLEQNKLEKRIFHERDHKLEMELREFDIKLDKQRDDQLTLEHYTESYVPI